MSLPLTGTGSVFARLGRFGKVADRLRTYQAGIDTDQGTLLAQFIGLPIAVDGVPTLLNTAKENASTTLDALAPFASDTLIRMVRADSPAFAGSISDALALLVAQMKTAAASVQVQAVTASTAALSTNSGDGVIVVSTKRGDGLVQELTYPEISPIVCTADAQTGGATVGQETFTYTGEVADGNGSGVWADDWPIGSGATATLTAVDATTDGTSATDFGHMLVNSDFETWTVSNVPDGWTVLAGVAGTQFLQSTAQHYDGLSSLQFVGNATGASVAQTFNSSLGSPTIPLPSTSYAVAVWLKVDVVPAAGVLTIDLVDTSNTVINDDQGTANSFTVTCSTLTTSFAAKTGVFRLPKLVPTTVKLRVRLSTALSVGSNLFIDHLGMGRLAGLYAGGPGAAVFSGATQFAGGDGWNLTTTNDFGGASNLSTFQWLFDRLFGMRTLGLYLPSSGGPTISDALITT